MKNLYLLLTFLVLISCSKKDVQPIAAILPQKAQLPEWTLIPDTNFEKGLIARNYDDVLDGKVLTSKILEAKTLRLEHLGIKNTTGIENFINLEFISFWGNDFTTINVRSLKKLRILGLSECPVSEVDLSQNLELREINFQNNADRAQDPTYPYGKTLGFTRLDLKHNTKLEVITVWTNRLTELDVTMLPNLRSLWVGGAPGNSLRCGNPIQYLDLSKNPKLNTIFLGGCDLRYLNIKGTENGGVPRIFVKIDNPNLFEVKVSSVAAIEAYRSGNTGFGFPISEVWYAKDPHTKYVE